MPPAAQQTGRLFEGQRNLYCCCSHPALQGPELRPLLSQLGFPYTILKVARTNLDQRGMPGVETFIERRGLGFQPLPLARARERG